jgi:pimeloyl-ACP methyl ester carboxylesterase
VTPSLDAHGFTLAYEERGEGAPVLLVHGMGCDRSVWRDVPVKGRSILYDRRAYGESGAPEPYGATSVEEKAEDAASLLGEPTFVVGHSFGALVALDLMRRRPELVSGALVAEPPLLWLVESGSEAMGELREAVESGAREAGAAGAVSACMTVLAGPGWEEILGAERADASKAHARGLLADLAGTANWTATGRELRALAQPVTVLSGSRTPEPHGAAARALAELLPNASFEQIDSGWLGPAERPEAFAAPR